MNAAEVNAWGSLPQPITITRPTGPAPDSDLVQIHVLATGLHRAVRVISAGLVYASANALPHTPGIDGVGRTAPDGQLVYFSSFGTAGSFVEYLNVPKRNTVPLPETADPVQVAGLVNPTMSSWMALKTRVDTSILPQGFTVLILGVTTLSGRNAIAVSKTLGAGKVIGVARNEAAMENLGLDSHIALADSTDYTSLGDVDVILDYLYVQYVNIGTLAAHEVSLSGSLLRSKNVTLRGSGPGAFSMMDMGKQMPEIVMAVTKLEQADLRTRGLNELEEAWKAESERTVFVP